MSVPLSTSGTCVWTDSPDAMVLPMLVTVELLDLDREWLGAQDSDFAIGWDLFTMFCDVVDGLDVLFGDDE